MLIVFEGIDGSGKSTLVQAFADDMAGRDRHVTRYAFPTRGPIGMLARQAFAQKVQISPIAYQHLMVADALDSEDSIRDNLAQHNLVLVDRHPTISGLVYQTEVTPLPTVIQINAMQLFTPPTLVVLVDVPAEIAVTRIHQRGGGDSDYEHATVDIMAGRRSRYMAAMAMLPFRYMIVDGQESPRDNVDKIYAFMKRLALRIN